MICKNRKCRALLKDHHWGDGYCSRACLHSADREESEAYQNPVDPNSPAAFMQEMERNAAFFDAMYEAFDIDPLLPRIIYLRIGGATYREVGKMCGISGMQCYRLMKSVTRKVLKACGL